MALEQNPIQKEAEDASLRLRRKNAVKNASDEELELSLAAYEEFEKAFSGVVLVGVLFEFFVAYLHPSYDSPRGVWGPIIGDALVAIGILAEVFCGTRSKALQSELTRRSNERLGDAIERAEEARRRTAEIERLTAFRHLSPETKGKLIAAAQQSKDSIDLMVEFERSDTESFSYAREIVAAFRSAGVVKTRMDGNSWGTGTMFGLWATSKEIALSPLVESFAGTETPLRTFEYDLTTHLSRQHTPPNLYLFVAPKPPPEPSAATPVGAFNEPKDANSEAAEAKAALQRISSPRTPDKERFLAALVDKPKPAKISVRYSQDGADCAWLATWIASHLCEAGWPMEPAHAIPIAPSIAPHLTAAQTEGGQPWGVTVLDADLQRSEGPTNALTAALFASLEDKNLAAVRSHKVPPGEIRVIVAPRP